MNTNKINYLSMVSSAGNLEGTDPEMVPWFPLVSRLGVGFQIPLLHLIPAGIRPVGHGGYRGDRWQHARSHPHCRHCNRVSGGMVLPDVGPSRTQASCWTERMLRSVIVTAEPGVQRVFVQDPGWHFQLMR